MGEVRRVVLKKWKEKNEYHRRSLSETAFSQLKKIFGGHVASRVIENQTVELSLLFHVIKIFVPLLFVEDSLNLPPMRSI